MFKKVTLTLPLLFITLGFSLETVGAAPAAARAGVLRGALNGAKTAYNNKWKLGVGAGFGYSYLDLWNKNTNFEQRLKENAVNMAIMNDNIITAEAQRRKSLLHLDQEHKKTHQQNQLLSEGLLKPVRPDLHNRMMNLETATPPKIEGSLRLIEVTPYVQLRERLSQPFTSLTKAIDTMNQLSDAKVKAMQAKASMAAFLKNFAKSASNSDNPPFTP